MLLVARASRVPSGWVLGGLVLCVACQREPVGRPAPSSSVRALSSTPSAVASVAAVATVVTTPVRPHVNARTSDLGFFGFRRAELPTLTGYVHERARVGPRPTAAFKLGAMLVDASGGVWICSGLGEDEECHRMGRVPSADVQRMRARAQLTLNAPYVRRIGCKDCGGSSVIAYGPAHGSNIELATDGETPKNIQSPDADAVILWLLAIRERVRDRPGN